MKIVRTRFAPSPTGYLHVGGLRTALYAFLLAKQQNGQFLLRIEDTDQTRLVAGAEKNIIDALHWAGIDFDEGPGKGGPCGPYVQSERLPIYQKHAQELIEAGHAYYCFCSSERLEAVRAHQMASSLPPAYDKSCRNLSPAMVMQKKTEHPKYVVRMKIPTDGELTFKDLIRGDVTFNYKNVDDQVILKSDGFPTYHLAVVVDDHYMLISHVIRGEEWLSSTPKHVLLYQYFGWNAPSFSHLPLLLNLDRSKLSKRQGDVAVEDYRQKGYLPEALVNFIAFLGWNPGDNREIFTIPELIKEFSLERVGKSGAVFNVEKLDWLNQQYIIHMPAAELFKRIKPMLDEKGWGHFPGAYVEEVITMLKDRAILLPDFVNNGTYFFVAPTEYDEKVKTKSWTADSAKYLTDIAALLNNLASFDATSVEQAIRDYGTQNNLGTGKLIPILRLSLSGVGQGPSLFHMIAALGKQEVGSRIATACKILG